MAKKNIETLCKEKEQELIGTYFGNIVKEAVECPETIGGYTMDLPLKVEAEYKEFLKGVWEEFAPGDSRTIEDVLDEKRLKDLMTEDEREAVRNAFDEANKITLWERLTKTNHEDVAHYKGLLKEYVTELLFCLRCDFLEEVTGKNIENKAF